MTKEVQSALEKFILGKSLSDQELEHLKELFCSEQNKKELDQWLETNWEFAAFDDVEISFEKLRLKVQQYEKQRKHSHPVYLHVVKYARYYQRVAAVLFLPLVLGFLFFYMNSAPDRINYYKAEAPLGQKAKVELPDGSVVWLNSGSSIRYASDFDEKSRDVELQGEAFFEVQKNTGKPFFVHTDFLDVRVTGTRFNVNAYRDEPMVETSLVEGKVNVQLKGGGKLYQLTPGNALTFSKREKIVNTIHFNKEATISWKDNRLIFINDDFSKLVRKIEKWYDVKVVYNPEDFKTNKLTVKLLEGERLNRLLEIIESAIGANCTINGNKILITKK